MATQRLAQTGLSADPGTLQPVAAQNATSGNTWDAMETYFECITTCSLDDGDCVTRCVETLREHS
jgi:hypothetical protein